MKQSAHAAPPWPAFPILRHPLDHAHLSAVYCLASCVRWFRRLDDHPPTAAAVLARMMDFLPAKLPRDGIREKHLRQAADLYGLAIYRCGQTAGWYDLVDPTTPPSTVMIASVRGLPVPRMQKPPESYRLVLVLGIPDRKGRFLIADPHPDTPQQYRVPVATFETAWEATATETANPKALVVWRPER